MKKYKVMVTYQLEDGMIDVVTTFVNGKLGVAREIQIAMSEMSKNECKLLSLVVVEA